jgi:hypothetical protein
MAQALHPAFMDHPKAIGDRSALATVLGLEAAG